MKLTHDEWLEERRKGIGGSDAAAIVGLNPYATPFSVWADKTGRSKPKKDTEAMRQGRDLEQYVADRWMEATGKKCRRRTQILRNKEYPFAHANVDRWVVGENAGLECKTTNMMNLKKFKDGKEYPDTYYCQCMHYMAVTGADRWYLSVVVLGQGYYEFTIERDEEEIKALMDVEREFWEFVKTDTAPPVDGLKATTDIINGMYANSYETDESLDLFGRETSINAYFALKDQIAELSKEKERIEQELKTDLGNFEEGTAGSYIVKWKPRTRNSFQVKEFQKEYPDMDLSPFYKTTSYRAFEIKEVK